MCISTFNVGILALPLAYYGGALEPGALPGQVRSRAHSLTDPLTGLMNRRAFMRMSECEGGVQQALVVFDLDRFKRINDTHGHQAGDVVICQVAEALQSVLGASGEVARVGGEEFALLAPPTAYDDLIVKLIALRERVEATPIAIEGGTIRTTISAGLALRAPGESFANLYRRADQALYARQEGGAQLPALQRRARRERTGRRRESRRLRLSVAAARFGGAAARLSRRKG